MRPFEPTFEDVLAYVTEHIDDPARARMVWESQHTCPKVRRWFVLLGVTSDDEGDLRTPADSSANLEKQAEVFLCARRSHEFFSQSPTDVVHSYLMPSGWEEHFPGIDAVRPGLVLRGAPAEPEQISVEAIGLGEAKVEGGYFYATYSLESVPYGIGRVVAYDGDGWLGTCVVALRRYGVDEPCWALQLPLEDIFRGPMPHKKFMCRLIPATDENARTFSREELEPLRRVSPNDAGQDWPSRLDEFLSVVDGE